jgi:hypothetical protein
LDTWFFKVGFLLDLDGQGFSRFGFWFFKEHQPLGLSSDLDLYFLDIGSIKLYAGLSGWVGKTENILKKKSNQLFSSLLMGCNFLYYCIREIDGNHD